MAEKRTWGADKRGEIRKIIFALRSDLVEALDSIATRDGESRSTIVRRFLRDGIARDQDNRSEA